MSTEKIEINYKPLLGIEENPKNINWCPTGLPKSKGDVQEISLEDMGKIISKGRGASEFKWTENYWVAEDNQDFNLSEPEQQEYRRLISNGLELSKKLCLYWVNDDIGFGICAIEDIKKDEQLLYSGNIASSLEIDEKQGYVLTLPSHENKKYRACAYYASNYASFLNASLAYLNIYAMNEIIKEHELLAPNFKAASVGKFGVLEADQDINAFTPLAWDYGTQYWLKMEKTTNKESFLFFNNSTGEPIPREGNPWLYNTLLPILFAGDSLTKEQQQNLLIDSLINDINSNTLTNMHIAFSVCCYEMTIENLQQLDIKILKKIKSCCTELESLKKFLDSFSPEDDMPAVNKANILIIEALEKYCKQENLRVDNTLNGLKYNYQNLNAIIEYFENSEKQAEQSFGGGTFNNFLVSEQQKPDPRKSVKQQLEEITGLANKNWKISSQSKVIWAQFDDEASRDEIKEKIEKCKLDGIEILTGKSKNKFILKITYDSTDLSNLAQQFSKINFENSNKTKDTKIEFQL